MSTEETAELGKLERQIVKENYSSLNMALKTAAIYKEILHQ
jgi:hypothetical protein